MADPHLTSDEDRLHALAETGDSAGIQALLRSLEPAEAVRAFYHLAESDQRVLVEVLEPMQTATLLDDLPEEYAAEVLENIAAPQAAVIVEALPSDRSADLLAALAPEDKESILAEMSPAAASEVRSLISWSSGAAGSLMGPEHFAYPENAAVGNFLEDLRQQRFAGDRLPQRIVLTDADGRPSGAVELADILLAAPDTAFATLKQAIVPIRWDTDLDALDAYFERYETLGAPVIDAEGRLIGRLRRRIVHDAMAERAEANQLKVQGIVSGEELRSMAVSLRARRRLSWLSINIVLNLIAASVIAFYQDTLSAVIALAVFLPIVSDMSGCSGNQAVAVSLRELTLGLVDGRDLLRVWLRELSVGVINGLALGLLIAAVSWLWNGNPWLGGVVGAALAINTVIAVSIGGTVPLLLKRFDIDPAVASGPVLTTVTDMCGFFLVLGLATAALPLLS